MSTKQAAALAGIRHRKQGHPRTGESHRGEEGCVTRDPGGQGNPPATRQEQWSSRRARRNRRERKTASLGRHSGLKGSRKGGGVMYKGSSLERRFGNDSHWLGNSGEGAQAPRSRVLLLPHGRPDDGGGNRHHGRRHPRDRRAARTGRGDDGPRVGPHSEPPGGLHGGVRTRHHQPHHRCCTCLGRLRPRGRARWVRPARSVRARRISGDRSARDDEARHEVGRASARSTPDPGVRQSRVRMRHVGQARAGVPRPSGRCALHPGRGGRYPLEGTAERQGPPPPESLGGSGRRHPPPARGSGATHCRLGRRHPLVGGGSGARDLRRAFRNPLLHDAPRAEG